MAAEALIVEDAYQKGYADAMADMRKKKEQRRQREQEKKARRWYFIKQKAYGLAMLVVTVLAVWAAEGDITIAVITVPLGLMKPLEPDQTAQYKFSDLQMSLYYTIYIQERKGQEV